MKQDLDKILHQQTVNIISLMLITIFLYFKNGIYESKELLEKIKEIKKKMKNNKEIIKHFKVEYESIRKLEFVGYFNSIHNKETIIDYSNPQLSENMQKVCISVDEEIEEMLGTISSYESSNKKKSLFCIDKKNVEKLGYIFAFELDNILMYQKLDYDLLPYRVGKGFAKEILNIIKKENNVDPFEIINFALSSFVNGLLNGFFEKYKKLDKKEVEEIYKEEISENVYIFKSGEEYLNTLEKMLKSIYYIDLKDIISNSINLIKENGELFKKIEDYGKILGYSFGEYLNNNQTKIYEIYNKYIEFIVSQ
jgi:hypothetical protein